MTQSTESTALGELRSILELVPSPLNPRKHFDKQKLEELAASIASKGIIEPLVVRRTEEADTFEIVAGERRYRAAKLAAQDLVPVIIRTLTDVEVLELMAIENSQRDDLHPLEEADGYRALMKADRSYTPEAIAAKIGKSKRYVQQRLALGRLEPAVKTAFFADEIQAGHADLISRLKADDQAAALKACFHTVFSHDDDKDEDVRVCVSVRELDRWIENNVRIEISADDPQTAFLPELADVVATPEAATILQVASGYLPESLKKQILGTALPSEAYRRVQGKKDRCPHAQRAVIVIGDGRGKFLEVCTAKAECKTHWKWEIETAARVAKEKKATTSGTRATQSPRAAAADKKAKEQRAAEQGREGLRRKVLDAAWKRFQKCAPAKPSPALLALLVETMPWYSGVTKAATWKALALAAVAVLRDDYFGEPEYKALAKLLKPLGLDLAAIEQELAPKAAAQTSAPKKKAAKR